MEKVTKAREWVGRTVAGASLAATPLMVFADPGVSGVTNWVITQLKLVVIAVAAVLLTLSLTKKEYTKAVIIFIVAALIFFLVGNTGVFSTIGEWLGGKLGLN